MMTVDIALSHTGASLPGWRPNTIAKPPCDEIAKMYTIATQSVASRRTLDGSSSATTSPTIAPEPRIFPGWRHVTCSGVCTLVDVFDESFLPLALASDRVHTAQCRVTVSPGQRPCLACVRDHRCVVSERAGARVQTQSTSQRTNYYPKMSTSHSARVRLKTRTPPCVGRIRRSCSRSRAPRPPAGPRASPSGRTRAPPRARRWRPAAATPRTR
jgi:hypothetical protein